jgi:acetyl esterase/lipase
MIVNSFKENGENYNSTIGNINEGNNYEKNERNVYSLYIPYSATQRKTENNHIILFIHGGSWIGGDKESLEPFCRIYAQMGYITATLGYTLLNGDYKNYNIFRQLDEITACIQSI